MGEADDLAAKYGLTAAPAAVASAPDADALAAKYGIAPAPYVDKVAPYGLSGMVSGKHDEVDPPGIFGRIVSGVGKAANVAGTLASDFVDAATGGAYKTARDYLGSKVAPDATNAMLENEARAHEGAAGQFAEGTARGLGYLNPYSVSTAATRAAAAGVEKLAGAAPGLVGRALSSRPVVSGLVGALGSGASVGQEALTQGATPAEALREALPAAAIGGGLGLATGAASAVKASFADGSPSKARARILSDIQGDNAGYSTKTARNQAIRQEKAITEIVMHDPQLETDLFKAKTNDVGKLNKVIDTVNDRLDAVSEPRPAYYKDFDAALAAQGKPATSGAYVDHLLSEAKALDATGSEADRKISARLRHQVEILRTAEDWGYRESPPVAAKAEYSEALANTIKRREAFLAKGVPVPLAIDEAIEAMSAPQKSSFDPNHVVSALKVRENVNAMQKAAESSEGGLHGTPNYELGREVEERGASFLRGLKKQAAAVNPQLIETLNEHDKTVSALLHLRQVLDQRVTSAKLAGMGAEGDDMFGRVLHTVAKGKHGVIRAVEAEGAQRLSNYKRTQERAARGPIGETDNEYAARVMEGLRNGLPLKAAVAAATVTRETD